MYSRATMYVEERCTRGNMRPIPQGRTHFPGKSTNQQIVGGWQGYKKRSSGPKNMRIKAASKSQQLHYCEVCKISCDGPQSYVQHLEGQKHKKREVATKITASLAVSNQNRAGKLLRCQLCNVTCSGNRSYNAHIRGSKHSRVVMLHTKLGKPIPPQQPKVFGGLHKSVWSIPKINFVQSGSLFLGADNGGIKVEEIHDKPHLQPVGQDYIKEIKSHSGEVIGFICKLCESIKKEIDDTPEPDIKPVEQDYMEEIKSDDGEVIGFNCKLCECILNDPKAKESHRKGRRHRLNYKKKVIPDLVVDLKQSLLRRKIKHRTGLGMEPFPIQQNIFHRDRSARKRRRSEEEQSDSKSNTGKKIKIEDDSAATPETAT